MLTAGAALLEAITVFAWVRGLHPMLIAVIAIAGVVVLLAGYAYLERREKTRNRGTAG